MKKIWDKKSMLNFSRQAYNEKVTDCHALFRILRFFELGCFLGRNIDLGGSFPTHDLKFGQFCDSTKNFGPPKFCWNFVGIFRFFLNFWKKYYFLQLFFTEKFAKLLWLLATFHTPLVYEVVWKIAPPEYFYGCSYIEILRFSMSAIIYWQNPCKLPTSFRCIKAYMLAFSRKCLEGISFNVFVFFIFNWSIGSAPKKININI